VGKSSVPKREGEARAGSWGLPPIILATQEAEINKIAVQSQPGQIVLETLSRKKSFTKKGC
jgi:hypothetical protein